MKARRPLTFFMLLVIVLIPATHIGAGLKGDRPREWAQPILMEGVPNLHRVSEDLYRSAQPTVEGMRNLPFLFTASMERTGLERCAPSIALPFKDGPRRKPSKK